MRRRTGQLAALTVVFWARQPARTTLLPPPLPRLTHKSPNVPGGDGDVLIARHAAREAPVSKPTVVNTPKSKQIRPPSSSRLHPHPVAFCLLSSRPEHWHLFGQGLVLTDPCYASEKRHNERGGERKEHKTANGPAACARIAAAESATWRLGVGGASRTSWRLRSKGPPLDIDGGLASQETSRVGDFRTSSSGPVPGDSCLSSQDGRTGRCLYGCGRF